ncbi:MAG: site-specific DNA-methyltransferase [Staphylococcus sp.]|nr:site-specific DNA-methyltransferase [Staphylococcus sp.]
MYGFNFIGKESAKLQADVATTKKFLFCKEESVNFDTTQNLYIVGDNLDALKKLQEKYLDKIDVIYIDPPYNTGKKFVYNDNFKSSKQECKKYNLSSTQMSISNWCSMMYPRLVLARKLLSHQGVIFISIDDNMQAYLKVLCDEIFGELQTDVMVWRKSGVGRDGKMKNTITFRKDHEYIIVAWKKEVSLSKSFEKPNFQNEYKNLDNDPRGPYKAGSISRKEEASNPASPNYYTVISPAGKKFTRQFDISIEEFNRLDKAARIFWGKEGNSVPSIKIFINEPRFVTTSSIIDNVNMTTTIGSKELNIILDKGDIGERVRPKPTALLKKIIQISSKKNSIILDFFAGSGTTGQAVMELNAEDCGNRQCILVQLDEKCNEKSEAYKAGYRTIDEISRERIKRAAKRIKEKHLESNFDDGFKVLKLIEK